MLPAAIPATVVAAASFDDAIAITGYTLFINLAVQGGSSTAWNVAHGPLSIVFGVLAGGLAGLFCSATKLWSNPIKRTFVMFLTGERASCISVHTSSLPSSYLRFFFPSNQAHLCRCYSLHACGLPFFGLIERTVCHSPRWFCAKLEEADAQTGPAFLENPGKNA